MSAVTKLPSRKYKDGDDDGEYGELEVMSIRQLDDESYIVKVSRSEAPDHESSFRTKEEALKYIKEIM